MIHTPGNRFQLFFSAVVQTVRLPWDDRAGAPQDVQVYLHFLLLHGIWFDFLLMFLGMHLVGKLLSEDLLFLSVSILSVLLYRVAQLLGPKRLDSISFDLDFVFELLVNMV